MGGVVRIAKMLVGAGAARPVAPPAFVAPPAPAIKPEPEILAPEVEGTSEAARLLKNKKRGSGSTLLTGQEGSLGSPNIERKSLLGN